MPELVNNSSSAISSDDNRVASLPIARKKKAVLEVSRGKCVLVSNTSDDNESMGKLFASNLKVAVDKMAKSNSYANKLAENIAEFKIAALRVCTSYAKYFDESSACNAEPRIEHLTECLNLETDNKAATYVSHAFNAKKTSYTSLQWQDMAAQRAAWLKKTRPHDAITFVHKCSNVSDLLTKECDPATKQAILSMVKAPPTTIGMGRPSASSEVLWWVRWRGASASSEVPLRR